MNQELHEQIRRRADATIAIVRILYPLSELEAVEVVRYGCALALGAHAKGLSLSEALADLEAAAAEAQAEAMR